MKKIAILLIMLIAHSTTALANENWITVDPMSSSHLKLTKHWKLTPWHDYVYYISNPTQTTLHFTIEIAPTSTNRLLQPVPSAPIKLTCGGKEFYITLYSSQGITVCETNKAFYDIQFELLGFEGNPSEGEFTIDF